MSNFMNPEICNRAILSNDYEDILIDYTIGEQLIQSIYNPACVQEINERIAVVYIPRSSASIDTMQKYGYNNVPKCYGLLDTSAVDSVGVFRLRRLPFINLNGRNVILGFIDTGIDYRHKAFINADNSSRIIGIWDQTIESGNKPQGFLFGSEYTNRDITSALNSNDPLSVVPSIDTNGHGTFLAGIAAGNIDEDNDFSGIAPSARIAMVKLKQAKPYLRDYYGITTSADCFQENDIMLGIRYLYNLAVEYNLPLVICMGVGSNMGGHEGTSFLSTYIEFLSSVIGIACSVGAGNEGNLRHHSSGLISNNSLQTVELEVSESDPSFTIELWNNQPGALSVGFLSPGGEEVQRIPVRYNSFQRVQFFPEPTSIDINFDPNEPRSGDAVVQMRFRNMTSGIWNIRLYNDTSLEINYHMWLPMYQFISGNTYFIRPDPDTTITSPGNGFSEITCTAYNHQTNSIYLNSSRGYTRRGRIKPDITAPGVNVFGPGLLNTYTTRTGTSVSAAITAGLTALLFEWGIIDGNMLSMSGNTARLLFIRGAQKQDLVYPNKEWGNGQIDIYNVFQNIRATQ